jgi:hypothetical protein
MAIRDDKQHAHSGPDNAPANFWCPFLVSATLNQLYPSVKPRPSPTTDIYTAGTLTAAVAGWAIGWLDDTRLLVEQFNQSPPPPSTPGGVGVATSFYTGAGIFSPSGANVGSSAIPQSQSTQVLGSDSIYSPNTNSIYSVSTSAVTWESADAFCFVTLNFPTCNATSVGAVSGSQVIFSLGSFVLAQPY